MASQAWSKRLFHIAAVSALKINCNLFLKYFFLPLGLSCVDTASTLPWTLVFCHCLLSCVHALPFVSLVCRESLQLQQPNTKKRYAPQRVIGKVCVCVCVCVLVLKGNLGGVTEFIPKLALLDMQKVTAAGNIAAETVTDVSDAAAYFSTIYGSSYGLSWGLNYRDTRHQDVQLPITSCNRHFRFFEK